MAVRSLFHPAVIAILLCSGCKTQPFGPAAARLVDQEAPSKSLPYSPERDLNQTVQKGDLQQVRSLIAEGASINAKDDFWQRTPLHFAAESGRCEIADLLIAAGADLNARDTQDKSPLHLAVFNGRKEMVELLLASGADVSARGGECGDTPLHNAVMGGDYSNAAIELVKARRPDVNDKDDLYWDLQETYSEQLMVEITQILLAHGADIRAKDRLGLTAWDCAFSEAPVQVIDILLAHGADPDAKSEDGLPVLHQAIVCGRKDVLPMLLKNGANVNSRDRDKQTPLHEAVWQGNAAMVELLIANKAAINAKDRNGDMPAHIAASIGDAGLYDLLVARGADVTAKNKRGLTPPDCVRLAPPQKMIRLSEDGAKPYSVIVTNLRAIRALLGARQIGMMGIQVGRIWIPSPQDVRQAETIMRLVAENSGHNKTEARSPWGHFSADIDQYNREYCGFVKGKSRYVVCNMNAVRTNLPMLENRFTGTGVMDGGCDFILVVIALDKGQVFGAMCNGM